MKGSELLENALSVLGTSCAESPEYSQYAVSLINLLIAETNAVNNSLRVSKDKAELSDVPSIAALADDLPTEPELNRSALVYGLCSKLLLNDDDMARVSYFQNMCVAELESAAKCVANEITDVYGGEGI